MVLRLACHDPPPEIPDWPHISSGAGFCHVTEPDLPLRPQEIKAAPGEGVNSEYV